MTEKKLKVFYSWQSDLPTKNNKDLIHSALAEALESVSKELSLSEADRPQLDHDTKDEPGWVEIFNTIIKKINESAAFVADVTPIASTKEGKLVPNPNVMLELGHAMKALGTDPIILVANSAYIEKVEQFPFDMRHRRGPITFKASETDDKATRATAKKGLAASLAGALKLNLSATISQLDASKKFPLTDSKPGDPSSWLSDPETIEYRDFFGNAAEHQKPIQKGLARSYLRVSPAEWPSGLPTRLTVQNSKGHLWPMGRYVAGDGGANSLGVAYVGFFPGNQSVVHTATQWFQRTGELWTFDGNIAGYGQDEAALATSLLIEGWTRALKRYFEFFALVGAKGPFRVEAGVTGLTGVTWPGVLASERVRAVDAEAIYVDVARVWEAPQICSFVTAAFNKVCDAFDRPHVSTEDMARNLKGMLS